MRKNMVRLMILLVMCFFSLCNAQAQTAPSTTTTDPAPVSDSTVPADKPAVKQSAKLQRLVTALGLSPEQASKISKIWKTEVAKMGAAQGDQDQITAIRSETESKIIALLSPDQQTKYSTYKASLTDDK